MPSFCRFCTDACTIRIILPKQALQRIKTPKLHGVEHIHLNKPTSRRRHGVAHPTTHYAEPCEFGGIVEISRSEDMLDDDVVGKVGDRGLRVGKARGSSGGRDITARGSHDGM
jgi:hypothetical protein